MSNVPSEKSASTTGQKTSKNAGKTAPRTTAQIRDDRLKSALKANMAKRKMQTRARKVSNNKNSQAE